MAVEGGRRREFLRGNLFEMTIEPDDNSVAYLRDNPTHTVARVANGQARRPSIPGIAHLGGSYLRPRIVQSWSGRS